MSTIAPIATFLAAVSPRVVASALRVSSEATQGIFPRAILKLGAVVTQVYDDESHRDVANTALKIVSSASAITVNRLGGLKGPLSRLEYLAAQLSDPELADKTLELANLIGEYSKNRQVLDLLPDDSFTVVDFKSKEELRANQAEFEQWVEYNPTCSSPAATPADRLVEVEAMLEAVERDLMLRNNRTGVVFSIPSSYLSCRSVLLDGIRSHTLLDSVKTHH